jgi:aryl-alcohol dehydrogenase-like predicted oxidoreductase
MDYRFLGGSGLSVPVLAFGTATFGGTNDFFHAWGTTQVEEATRLIDIALDAGVNLFDTADGYSDGVSEEILGQAIGNRRSSVLLATKLGSRTEPGTNGVGTSRFHIIRACEASLRRLKTDYIDLYQLHGFDTFTPIEETLRALEDLITSGKVRYIGCSNFSGWHLMKSLALSEKYGLPRHIAHQAYYSLVAREYEWELMPLAIDQQVSTLVWSPLAGGRLSGKYRRNQALPQHSRVVELNGTDNPTDDEYVYNVIDAMDAVAAETGKTHSQIALNWLLQRPTVSSVIIGARNEAQLRENLGAVGWNLTPQQIDRLDAASATRPIYPYWHQYTAFRDRNIPPTYPHWRDQP